MGCFFIITVLLWMVPGYAVAQIYINEVLASNGGGIPDKDGDNVPWIELYNAGEYSVRLKKYGLSDDYEQPFRWVVPEVKIAPGAFKLIFASGKDRRTPEGELHTNFRVSKDGEEVLLTDPEGVRVDEMSPTPMPTDVSFGRKPDGSDNWYFFDDPTPGVSNTSRGYQDILEPPEFSEIGGFFRHPLINLNLTAEDEETEIRYSLDGSEPDSSSRLYDGPILIEDRSGDSDRLSSIQTTPQEAQDRAYRWKKPDGGVYKGTVVRARAFRDGARPSDTRTHTYFIDEQQGGDRYPLRVVSLVTDSLNLFDHEEGIYIPGKIYEDNGFGNPPWGSFANYFQRGIQWERPASFELYSEKGELIHHQDIGIRIHGGGSRALPLKSFRLYARNDYGDSRFNHRIFPDLNDREFNRLILRNSGQDFYKKTTMFRDAFMQELMGDFNFDTQAYRPSVVFVSGEYWGIMNFRERYDEDYIARTYGVEDVRIDLLTGDAEVKEGSGRHYRQMLSFVEDHDLAEDEHFEELKTMMDTDNFMDYLIAQIFLRNTDWPANNIDYWRYQTEYSKEAPAGQDGRWRWMLFDTDFGFGQDDREGTYDFNMFDHITDDESDHWSNQPWSTFLIRNVLKNESFQLELINRYLDYLNTVFRPENTIAILDDFESELEPVIQEHIERWGYPSSKERWRGNIEEMREFAEKRPDYTRSHLKKHFGLGVKARLQVDISAPSHGTIKVNSLNLNEDARKRHSSESIYPWSGTYVEQVPIRVEANAHQGYRFSHWETSRGTVDSDTLVLSDQPEYEIKAVFEKVEKGEYFPEAHVLAENDYRFDRWEAGADPGSYPDHMAFVYMDEPEPTLDVAVAGFTEGSYDLESRTRINGLGEDGFAFINTSNPEGNPGYPGRRLGGAMLAVDTRDVESAELHFTAGTVLPNSRVYNLRLQYRYGNEGELADITDSRGRPVEYHRHHQKEHTETFGPLELPEQLLDHPYVQFLWRYYFTGERMDDDSGQRSKLHLSDIELASGSDVGPGEQERPNQVELKPNYPNPFNNITQLVYELPSEQNIKLEVYTVTGRKVAIVEEGIRHAGRHTVTFDAAGMSSGVYLSRLTTETATDWEKMLLAK